MDLKPIAEGSELLRDRTPVLYSDAEQHFSTFVQRRIYRLLRGEDNDFMLMRRYGTAERGLAFLLPDNLDARDVRPAIAEQIIASVLRFLDPFAPGGPIAQTRTDVLLTEVQTFPTQYPHIVVERVDVFNLLDKGYRYIEWRAVRLQNQRRSTMVNRALDFGNLAIELTRLIGVH